MGVCGAVGGDGGGIEKVSDIMSVSAGERTGAGPDAAWGLDRGRREEVDRRGSRVGVETRREREGEVDGRT